MPPPSGLLGQRVNSQPSATPGVHPGFASVFQIIDESRRQNSKRTLGSVLRFALFASAALGADASFAQSCNNGVCPPIVVVGQLPGGGGFFSGGVGGVVGGGETSFDWQWQDGSGTPIAQPPAAALCPVVRAAWQDKNCANTRREVQPNGCGSGWSTMVVPNTYIRNGDVNFTTACGQHDLCYTRLGVPKQECDQGLLDDMSAVCRGSAGIWYSEANEQGLTSDERRAYTQQRVTECTGQAIIYFGALQTFGLPAYRNAQAGAGCAALLALSNDNHCGITP